MRFLVLSLTFLLIACLPVKADNKFLDIQEITSKGGITAWLVEDHSLPIISLQFSFKGAGAIRDGVDKQGLATLLSNTMDEGAGDLTSQEFQKILGDKSITLRFSAGRDNFGGQLKTLSRHKSEAFNLLKLSLSAPRFDDEPLKRMKQANLSRIRSSMGEPDWIAARIFNDKAYAGHPYALNAGGTLTTLPNLSADDLRGHVKEWLTQDRLHIGVMGDITAADLSVLLDDVFGVLPKQGSAAETPMLSLQNEGKVFVYNQDIPQSILSLAMPSIDPTDPDYYALQVMNYIFGAGGFGSRLMEEAREKRGLTYGIYSGLSDQDYIDLITISTSTKNASVAEMMGIVRTEIDRIKSAAVSAEELADSKAYLTGSLPLSLSSTDRISDTLLNLQLDNRPIDYLDSYAEKINAVSVEDIQKIANKILDQKKMMTIMVGQPENIESAEIVESLNNVK